MFTDDHCPCQAVVLCGWLTCAVLLCAPAYCTYGVLKEGGSRWTEAEWVMFDTFSRTAWGIGIAWIIVACQYGYAGMHHTQILHHELLNFYKETCIGVW